MNTIGMPSAAATETLGRLEAEGTTPEAVWDLFDALPAMPRDAMLGQWKSSELRTGHPLDGLLEAFGWYGKAFVSAEVVHPLLFRNARGTLYSLDSSRLPAGLLTKLHADSLVSRARGLFKVSGALLSTKKPSARLRMMDHRGVSTAAMIYDTLPIQDLFRRVDARTVLGFMDLRGLAEPYFFILRKDPKVSPLFEELQRAA